jgi:hypothetical protein
MSSWKPSAPDRVDLAPRADERDRAALRKGARPRLTPEAYLRFLAELPVDHAALRKRRGPRGEPFTLPPVSRTWT